MKAYILMGSPRKNGNTISIIKPFIEEFEALGNECELVWLYDKNLKPCMACRTCQKDWTKFGCSQEDDMQEIFDGIINSDLIVIASPIYSWYCTPPTKCVLDRMVYGMNKYYGEEKGPAIWSGKNVAIITTCGYRPENGADLFEQGVKRYCKHSQLNYIDMLAERDLGYKTDFISEEKVKKAKEFADNLNKKLKK